MEDREFIVCVAVLLAACSMDWRLTVGTDTDGMDGTETEGSEGTETDGRDGTETEGREGRDGSDDFLLDDDSLSFSFSGIVLLLDSFSTTPPVLPVLTSL